MRSEKLAATLIALSAFVAIAAPAGAVVTNTAGGRVSYLPLNQAAGVHSGSPIRNTFPTGEPPLKYHGGPVMHSQTAYAIFWAPSGFSFPAGYESAITSYLQNVVADSGKPSNVYSVSAQYTDGSGNASYIDSYGGSVKDSAAYPTSGTCPTYTGLGEGFTACIVDGKMKEEVDSVIGAQGWPTGLGAEYYVVLPPQVGSCFEVAAHICFDKQFCAYHGFTAGGAIYSNISYSPGDPTHCGVEQYPNGNGNGNVDDTLSSLSHEANESITDPHLNAWYDEEGNENGDECRNTPFGEDYGAPLGGSSGTLFNQAIGSGHYYLQQEWSNDIFDCAQRVDPATPVISDPGEVAPGQTAFFSAAGSQPGAGGIVSYEWDFGDGATAIGEAPSHVFATSGNFTVTLTVEDDGGFQFSTTRQVTVAVPSSGGEGGGSSAAAGSIQTTVPASTPVPAAPRALKCRKGFRKARKHGKTVCAKVRKKHGKRR